MALSIYSGTFQNTFDELDNLIKEGRVSNKQERDSFLMAKEINPEDYDKGLNKFKKAVEQGKTDDDFRPIDIPVLGQVARTSGRFVGETVGGVVDFVDAFTPEAISNAIGSAADAVGESLPEELMEGLDAIFDPYHGEHGGIENFVGTAASYVVPGGLAVKGVNLALKANKLATSPATRSLTRKKLKGLEEKTRKEKVKNIRRAEYLKTRGLQGTAAAGAVTVVEDPDENIANILIDSFPESTQFMERLYVDPTDSEAEKYLQSLINNLGFGLAISPFYIANAFKAKTLKPALLATKPIDEAAKLLEESPVAPSSASDISIPIGSKPVSKFGKLKNFVSEYGTSRRGTDDTTLALAIERDNLPGAVLREVEGLNNTLKETVENTYGPNATDINLVINSALKTGTIEGKKSFDSLKPEVQEVVLKMRNLIDNYSQEFAGGLDPAKNKTRLNQITKSIQQTEKKIKATTAPKEKQKLETRLSKQLKKKQDIESEGLKFKVTDNLGVHLTRSYNYFDDPTFRNNVMNNYKKFIQTGEDTNGVFVSSLDAIKKQTGADDAKAKELLDKLLVKADKPSSIFDGFVDLSKKLTSAKSTKERSDIPEVIRVDLLGEVKDPYRNFANTMSNLSKLTAETRFIDDIQNTLLNQQVMGKNLGTKITTGRPGEIATQRLDSVLGERLKLIFGEAAPTVTRPFKEMEDVYVSDEYAKMIKEGLKQMEPNGTVMRTWMGLKGASQASQTVGSVTTHGRNTIGNTFFLLANGMNPFGKSVYQGAKDSWKGIMSSSDEEIGKRLATYERLGLLNSNVDLNVMKQSIKGAGVDPDEWFKNIEKHNYLKKGGKFITDLYQLEDDMFKIAHFENTLKYLRKSKKFKGLPEEDILREAGQRTRDLMPNYSLVNKAIKKSGKYVLGDYMAFPAEVIRVSKNLGQYAIKDLKSGDSELMKQGAKRLAGTTAVAIGPAWASDYSKNINGITDEQGDALNSLDSPWNYNKDMIYLSPINKDKNGHVGVDKMSFGYIDPFSYLKTVAVTGHSLIASGFAEESDKMTDVEFDKALLGMVTGAASPFLAPSMLTEAIVESGEKASEGKLGEAGVKLLNVFNPGTLKLIQKRAQYESELKLKEPYGLEPVKKGSFTMSRGEVDLLAALGLKRERQDLTASVPFALKDVFGEIDKSGKDYEYLLRQPALTSEYGFSDFITGKTKSGTGQIRDSYIKGQKNKVEGLQKLQSLIDDYESIFGSDYLAEMERGYTEDYTKGKGFNSKQLDYLDSSIQNVFIPNEPKITDFSLLKSIAPQDVDDLMYIYNQYLGTRLK